MSLFFFPDHFGVYVFFSVPLSKKEFPTGNELSQTPWGRTKTLGCSCCTPPFQGKLIGKLSFAPRNPNFARQTSSKQTGDTTKRFPSKRGYNKQLSKQQKQQAFQAKMATTKSFSKQKGAQQKMAGWPCHGSTGQLRACW